MKKKEKLQSSIYRNRIIGQGEVLPSSLKPSPWNWRQHPALQKDAMAGALRELGWIQQIVVNQRTGHLVDGHLRLALALDAHEPTVPVLYVDLSEAEEKLALVSLDPLAALAQADQAKLAGLLAQVQSGDAAVQQMLAQLAVQEGVVPPGVGETPLREGGEPPDRIGALLERWPVQLGDLWACGTHRLLCSDCRDPDQRTRLLGDVIPTMIFADPPYGVSIVATNEAVGGGEAYTIPFGGVAVPHRRGYVGGGQRVKDQTGHYPIESWGKTPRGPVKGPFHGAAPIGKYTPVIGDESPQTAIVVSSTLLAAYPKAVHVWWGGNYYADALPASSCWLVWDKETGATNFADCELAWTNQPKAARLFRHRWNGMLRDSEHERRWHPTQKPAALAAWVFETLGKRGDVVLDPFLGSGPTLLAAEQTGRTLLGCELSQEYVAVCLARWSELTGQEPRLLESCPLDATLPPTE